MSTSAAQLPPYTIAQPKLATPGLVGPPDEPAENDILSLDCGDGAVYFTKQDLDTANFNDAIQLIRNGTRAFWCQRVQASTAQDAGGRPFCANQPLGYQVEEREE